MKLILIEAKSREEMLNILLNKYSDMNPSVIEGVLAIDPTKKCSYTQWYLKASDRRMTIKGSIEQARELFEFAQQNHDFQLQNFDTVSDAINGMDAFKGKNEFEIVFEDEIWRVYTPNSREAERYIVWHLHDGASWCTAAESEYGARYYKYYTDNGRLYVFFNKVEEWNGDEALFQYATCNSEFRDKDNENISIDEWDKIGGNDVKLEEWFKQATGKDLDVEVDSYGREQWFEEAEKVEDSKGDLLCYIYEHELYYDYGEPIPDTGTYYELDGRGRGYTVYQDYLIVTVCSQYEDIVDVLFRDRFDEKGNEINDARLKVVLSDARVEMWEESYCFALLSNFVRNQGYCYYCIDADGDFPGPPDLLKDITSLELIGDNYYSMFRLAYVNISGKTHTALFHPYAWCGEDEDRRILAYDVEDVELAGGVALFTKIDENGKKHRYQTDSSGEEMGEIEWDFEDEEEEEYVEESIKNKFWSLTNRLNEIRQRNIPLIFK